MGDYHPCPVDLVLDNFWLNRGRRRFRNPGSMRLGRPAEFSTEKDWLSSLVRSGANLSHAQINLRDVEADLPSTAHDKFFSLIENAIARQDVNHPYPVISYCRVVSGREIQLAGHDLPDNYTSDDYAIQYWYAYYYNHWWNSHELDWELVTVTVTSGEGDQWEPTRAGYAAHVSCAKREWADLNFNPSDANSPLVFVGAGSHASYFEYREQGYSTVARQLNRFPWLSRLVRWLIRKNVFEILSEDMIDLVPPNDPIYYVRPQVRMMPSDPSRQDPEWWWINYTGMWGEKPDRWVDLGDEDLTLVNEGPRGPRGQRHKWDNPFLWVDRGQTF